ncbi:MAG: hypothetical protein NZL83_01945 [Candidatus Absconditabacterales bacterium]|nr:hypothetical protein [Candidatus Absconditabacterales bacterium]
MSKKEYLIAFLDTLNDVRPEGQNIKHLIVQNELTDDIIDELVSISQQALNGVKDETKTAKIYQGLNFLEKLKHQEEEEKKQEAHDLDAMLTSIHDL